MDLVEDHQLLERHAALFQTPRQIDGLLEGDVAVVIALE
jgi:hypothetical protein